jgi:hypothetical protein
MLGNWNVCINLANDAIKREVSCAMWKQMYVAPTEDICLPFGWNRAMPSVEFTTFRIQSLFIAFKKLDAMVLLVARPSI